MDFLLARPLKLVSTVNTKARYERQRSLALYPFIRTYLGIDVQSENSLLSRTERNARGSDRSAGYCRTKANERYFIFSFFLSFYHSQGYKIQNISYFTSPIIVKIHIHIYIYIYIEHMNKNRMTKYRYDKRRYFTVLQQE